MPLVGDLKGKEMGRGGGAFTGGSCSDEEERGEGQEEKSVARLSPSASILGIRANQSKVGVRKPVGAGELEPGVRYQIQ